MKSLFVAVLCILCSTSFSFAQKGTVLKSEKDSISYGLGVNLATNLKAQSVDFDADLLIKGFRDMMAGSKMLLSEEQVGKTMSELQSKMMAKQHEVAKSVGAKNKKEGDAFLAANKKKQGIVTLPSGLQYQIIKAGNGSIPKADQTVTVNYRGTLLNGKEFANSYTQGQPLSLAVSGFVKGWSEALQLMPVGSKWKLFIPPQLAYGTAGQGEISPESTLIFEIELLSVK
jgi:FKBP-type peptidyl-prolyl cis-trans isomerase